MKDEWKFYTFVAHPSKAQIRVTARTMEEGEKIALQSMPLEDRCKLTRLQCIGEVAAEWGKV